MRQSGPRGPGPRGPVSSMTVPGRRGPLRSIAAGPGVNEERLGALVPGSLQTRGSRPAHVNQDVAGLSPPATAWPRRMLALNGQEWSKVRTVPSSSAGSVREWLKVQTVPSPSAVSVFDPEYVNQDVSGTHLPATAWPRQMLAVIYDPPLAGNKGWWYRLGCRVPTYESEVRRREPPDAEITEQVISQGKG